VRAGFLVAWLLLDVRGFRPVLARHWRGPRLSMRTTGVPLLDWPKSSVGRMLRVAAVSDRSGGLLYVTAVQPCAVLGLARTAKLSRNASYLGLRYATLLVDEWPCLS
jgi:hypothetical protein